MDLKASKQRIEGYYDLLFVIEECEKINFSTRQHKYITSRLERALPSKHKARISVRKYQ
jgi:hypothetical protein